MAAVDGCVTQAGRRGCSEHLWSDVVRCAPARCGGEDHRPAVEFRRGGCSIRRRAATAAVHGVEEQQCCRRKTRGEAPRELAAARVTGEGDGTEPAVGLFDRWQRSRRLVRDCEAPGEQSEPGTIGAESDDPEPMGSDVLEEVEVVAGACRETVEEDDGGPRVGGLEDDPVEPRQSRPTDRNSLRSAPVQVHELRLSAVGSAPHRPTDGHDLGEVGVEGIVIPGGA